MTSAGIMSFFGGRRLPYDYRVEWIETDGQSSYIDTGVTVDWWSEYGGAVIPGSTVEVTFQFPSVPPVETSYGQCVCGARYNSGSTASIFCIAAHHTSSQNRTITRIPTVLSNTPLTPIDTNIHNVIMANKVTIDGVDYATSSAYSSISNVSFMLGCSGDPSLWPIDSSTWHAGNARIYYVKILDGQGNVKLDAFPVVKDGKAGLYDRVSGKVLFNANTSGTITAGPQVPFDYEVEWIQRDVRYIWEKDGASVTGGYDLAEYIPAGGTVQNMPQYCLEGSCANTTHGPAHLVYYGPNIFTNLNIWKTINYTVYAFGSGTTGRTSTDAYLDVFHKFAWKGNDSGTYDMYLDGSLFGSRTYTSTLAVKFFSLLYTTLTGERPDAEIKFRIKRFKFGNTIDMIPVVKDDKMGFYNRVDGKVFLEKQPCLSAGPAIK